jgi:hypothetical protein
MFSGWVIHLRRLGGPATTKFRNLSFFLRLTDFCVVLGTRREFDLQIALDGQYSARLAGCRSAWTRAFGWVGRSGPVSAVGARQR